jgi:hypothetical protein
MTKRKELSASINCALAQIRSRNLQQEHTLYLKLGLSPLKLTSCSKSKHWSYEAKHFVIVGRKVTKDIIYSKSVKYSPESQVPKRRVYRTYNEYVRHPPVYTNFMSLRTKYFLQISEWEVQCELSDTFDRNFIIMCHFSETKSRKDSWSCWPKQRQRPRHL